MLIKKYIIVSFVLILFMASCCPFIGAEEKNEISHKVFRLCYVNASDIERLIKIFLSKDGMIVSYDATNTLIVKDYPDVIEKIGEFIAKQDKPQPHVRLYVRFYDMNKLSMSGWGFSLTGINNSWRVGFWGGGYSQSSSVSAEMNLMTISGTWGIISCGEIVPYPDWYIAVARNGGYIAGGFAYRDVSTGIAFMPVVKGEDVEVTVMPQISYFSDRERGIVRFNKASATVLVKSGQSVVLAGGDGEQGEIIRRILGNTSISQSQSGVIVLTPVIDRR